MKIFTKNWTTLILLAIWLLAIFIWLAPISVLADETCHWKYTAIVGTHTFTPQCANGETPAADNKCSSTEKPDSWLTSSGGKYHCCCQYIAPVYKPVKPIIPNIQIPIPNLSLSDMIDNAEEISIPWIAEYVIALYDYALIVAVILAGLALMVGGVMWLASSGDSGRVRKSQEIILGSVFGLILIFSGHVLLMTINPELTRFKSITINKIVKNTITYTAGVDLAANNCTIKLGENELPDNEDIVNSSPLAGSGTYSVPPGGTATTFTPDGGTVCSLNPGYSKNGFYFAGIGAKFSLNKPVKSDIYCPAAGTREQRQRIVSDMKGSQNKNTRNESIQNIRNRIMLIAEMFWLAEANTTKKITSYNCSTGALQGIKQANVGAYARNGMTVNHCVDEPSGKIDTPTNRKIQLFDCGGWVGYVYACAGLAIPSGPTFDAALLGPVTTKAKILGDITNISEVKQGEFFGITNTHAMLKYDKNSYLECVHNQNTKENTGCLRKSSTGNLNQYRGQQLITFTLEYIVDNTAKNFYGTK